MMRWNPPLLRPFVAVVEDEGHVARVSATCANVVIHVPFFFCGRGQPLSFTPSNRSTVLVSSHLAKLLDLMYSTAARGKYGAVIGYKHPIIWKCRLSSYKNASCLANHSALVSPVLYIVHRNHGILPDDATVQQCEW